MRLLQLISIGLFVVTSIKTKAQSLSLTQVGSIGYYNYSQMNQPHFVSVSGNYAFVGNFNSLEIIDISSPASPHHKGSLIDGKGGALLNGLTSIFISGSVAYITSYSSNALEIVNISKPYAPAHLSAVVNGNGSAKLSGPTSVYVSGNYAYVVGLGKSLEIIDVANPSNPVHKSSLSDGVGGTILKGPTSIVVKGNYAFISTSISSGTNAAGIEIIDISNPSNPTHVTNYNGVTGDHFGGTASLRIAGDYLYCLNNRGSLDIINISNPKIPTHVGSFINGIDGSFLDSPTDIFISDSLAYVTNTGGSRVSLEIIDISNPTNPVHKAALLQADNSWLTSPTSVWVSNNHAFITNSNELDIVDVSNISTPRYVTSFHSVQPPIAGPTSVFVSEDFAFVTSQLSNALEIVDISDPVSPQHVGSLSSSLTGNAPYLFSPNSVYVSGNFAYVASGSSNALEIIDISNPVAPVHKGSLLDGVGGAMLRSACAISLSGSYAYIASWASSALEIVDVSDPSAPVHKGSITDGSGGALLVAPDNLFIKGNNVYVTSYGSSSLEIIDVSDPSNPTHKGSISNSFSAFGPAFLNRPSSVYVSGNYAYVTSQAGNQLDIIDVSDSANPKHVSSIADGANGALIKSPRFVVVKGDYAFITSYQSNAIEVVDVSNPGAPKHKTNITNGTNGTPNYICVNNLFAYVTSYEKDELEVYAIDTVTYAPSAPIATVATNISNDGFTANWNAVAGANNYLLDVSSDNFQTYLTGFQTVSTGNVATVNIIGATAGTCYQYRVKAKNWGGASANSNVIDLCVTPNAPVATVANSIGNDRFSANWNPVVGATSYILDVSLDNFQTYLNGFERFSAGNVTTASVTGLTTGVCYQYRVRASNSGGVSTNSNDISVCALITDVEQRSQFISIYPNPTHRKIILDLGAFQTDQSVVIKIHDNFGRSILDSSFEGGAEAEIDMSDLPAGIYTMSARQSENIYYTKIMKR